MLSGKDSPECVQHQKRKTARAPMTRDWWSRWQHREQVRELKFKAIVLSQKYHVAEQEVDLGSKGHLDRPLRSLRPGSLRDVRNLRGDIAILDGVSSAVRELRARALVLLSLERIQEVLDGVPARAGRGV